jgi:hypothetical protein
MELCSEPEWLLLQILCWKAPPIGPFGQAIKLWVCAQRFVCVCGLAWSRMGLCSRRASTTPRRWRASSRRTKTTCVDPCANQIHSRSCLALNNQPLPFFLATLHLLTLKHTLGLLHRLNAQLRQRQKKDHPTHIGKTLSDSSLLEIHDQDELFLGNTFSTDPKSAHFQKPPLISTILACHYWNQPQKAPTSSKFTRANCGGGATSVGRLDVRWANKCRRTCHICLEDGTRVALRRPMRP